MVAQAGLSKEVMVDHGPANASRASIAHASEADES